MLGDNEGLNDGLRDGLMLVDGLSEGLMLGESDELKLGLIDGL
jgi:hypothetical protein